jgi:hypothetical protein
MNAMSQVKYKSNKTAAMSNTLRKHAGYIKAKPHTQLHLTKNRALGQMGYGDK